MKKTIAEEYIVKKNQKVKASNLRKILGVPGATEYGQGAYWFNLGTKQGDKNAYNTAKANLIRTFGEPKAQNGGLVWNLDFGQVSMSAAFKPQVWQMVIADLEIVNL